MADLVRESYGRLLALLAAPPVTSPPPRTRWPTSLERALQRWPDDGIPANPEAWVLTVARNRLRDMRKSAAYRMTDALAETPGSPTEADGMPAIPTGGSN